MKRIMAVFTLLFALSCLAACSPGAGSPTAEAIATPGAGWLTYTNNAYGFQFRYPPGSTIASSQTDTFGMIQLPFAGGTALVAKVVQVSVQQNVSPCSSPVFVEGSDYTTSNVAVDGVSWTEQAYAETPVGTSVDYTGYSRASGNVCVSLTFKLTANWGTSSATALPAYNKAAESQVFLPIVGSFQWLSGSAVTPTP